MNELMAAMARWLPYTLPPVLLALLAPLAGSRLRTVFAVLLGGEAIAAIVLAARQAGEINKLDVINPFIDPEVGQPVPFVVEATAAAGWVWPAVAAGFLSVAAVMMWGLRKRGPGAPCPVVFTSILTVWTLGARLALEKAAAPEGLTWAIGVTVPMLLMLPFVGWWAGVKRASFSRFLLMLLLIGLIQRSMIVGIGWLATTQGLGTHLDVGAVREVTLLLGHRDFTGPGDQTTAQWLALILIPQYLLWVPITVLAGVVLGALPRVLAARRRAAGDGPAAAGES